MKANSLMLRLVLITALLVAAAWNAGAQTTLTFLTHYATGARAELLQEYIAEYESLNPHIKVDLIPIANTTELLERIILSSAAGAPPDIININDQWISMLADLDILEPLSGDLRDQIEEIYIPQASSLAEINGELYGYTSESMVSAVIYNGKLLDEAGLSSQSPANWDEFTNLARSLTVTNGNEIVRAGFGLWMHYRVTYANLGSYLWSNGHGFFETDKDFEPRFNTPQAADALRYFADLAQLGYMKPAPSVYDPFVNEEMAIIKPHGQFYRGALRALPSSTLEYEKLGSWAVDWGETGDPVAVRYGWILSVPAASRAKDEAHKLLRWLSGDVTDRQTTRLGDIMMTMDSLPNTQVDLAYYGQEFLRDNFMQGFVDAFQNGTHHRNPLSIDGEDMLRVLHEAITIALEGGDIGAALENAQQKAMALRAE